MGLVQAEDAIDSFFFFFFFFLFSAFSVSLISLCSNPTKALMGLYKIMNHREGEALNSVGYI